MQLLRVAGATMLASVVTSTTSACAELAAGKLVADGLALTSNLVENSRVETEKDALTLAARGDRLRDRAAPDYTAAHDAYRMALKLEPRNPYLHVAIATAYIRQAHERLEDSYPSYKQWLGNPAAARDAKKFFGRAITSCNDALKINPNHFDAHFALAEAYARMERYQESLVKLDEIEGKQLIPVRQQAAFYAWRGYVRSQLGKRSASLEDLEHAVEVVRPYPFSEYADALANPPNACEWLSSCGAVARFDAVVGEPVPRAPRREQRLLPGQAVSPAPTPAPAPGGAAPTPTNAPRPAAATLPSSPDDGSGTPGDSGGPNPIATVAAAYFGGAFGAAAFSLLPSLLNDGTLHLDESSYLSANDDVVFFTGLGVGQLVGSTAATWATAGDTDAPLVVGAIGLVGLGATVIAVNTDREVANGGNVAVTPIVTNSVTFLASTIAAGVVTAGAEGE